MPLQKGHCEIKPPKRPAGSPAAAKHRYRPVAVTPQVTTKVAVELAGKLGAMGMPVVKLPAVMDVTGHMLSAVDAQVTAVQFSPVATGSVSTVPAAEDGPKLATVMV